MITIIKHSNTRIIQIDDMTEMDEAQKIYQEFKRLKIHKKVYIQRKQQDESEKL